MYKPLILALAAGGTIIAQSVSFQMVSPETINERFAQIQSTNETRATSLRTLFETAGCPAESWTEQKS